MSVHVFLGPSLPGDEARATLDAVYHPPAALGDVWAVARRRPSAIAVIDGFFEQQPAVWHKEFLFALERGIPVYGASSMGALRAAELDAFGMRGVGWVYEAFRSGALTDDDEVAVIHAAADDGYRPLSEAMVNLRRGLAQAVAEGVLSRAEHDDLIATTKRAHYPERSWPAVLAAAPPGRRDALRAFVRSARPNVKRDDARLLLASLAGARGQFAQPPPVAMERTEFWLRMVQAVECGEQGATHEEVLRHVRARHPAYPEAEHEALRLVLTRAIAPRIGACVSAAAVRAAGEVFRRERGLTAAADARRWMAEAELDPASFIRVMSDQVLTGELLAHHRQEVDRCIVDVLKRRGEWAEACRAALDARTAEGAS